MLEGRDAAFGPIKKHLLMKKLGQRGKMTNSGLLIRADTLAVTGDFLWCLKNNKILMLSLTFLPLSLTLKFIHKQLLLNVF